MRPSLRLNVCCWAGRISGHDLTLDDIDMGALKTLFKKSLAATLKAYPKK